MSKFRPFMRLGLLTIALIMAVSLAAPARNSQAADADTFYLSWPYEPAPKGNLNAFSPDGFTNNSPWSFLLTPTFGYYVGLTGEYKGWLAEKFGYSADNKKFSITLYKDLTWSDGTPITSKDVLATYNILLLTGGNGEYANGVEKVVAVDDQTVDFILNGVPGPVLTRLIMKELVVPASQYGKFGDTIAALLADGAKAGTKVEDIKKSDAWVAAEKALREFRPETVISSGPYSLDLKDFGPAQATFRRATKTKFGKLAKFEKVVVQKGDTDVTSQLILDGSLYYATDYFPPPVEKTFTDKGIKILRTPSLAGPALYFNHAFKPLDNLDIRQAFAYAIDRERVTKVSYGQIGKAVKYLTNYSDDRLKGFFSADQIAKFNTYAFDLKKADELMQKAGYKKDGATYKGADGKDFELELSAPADFTDWMPAAQDVADQLNAFGVKVTLRAVPNSQHNPDVRAGKFQMAIRLWGFPNPIPFYAYRNTYQRTSVNRSGTELGFSYPTSKKIGDVDYDFTALIAQLGAGTDIKPQNEAFLKLATAFNADLPTIPLVERFYNTPLVDTNVEGYPPVDDPIWGNVNGSDNAIVTFLMEGKIGPKKK